MMNQSSLGSSALISPPLPSEKLSGKLLKLGVMASGSGSNFAAIAEAIQAGQLNAEIPILIYNNPGAKVVERAEKFGISTQLLNHRDYPSREALDRDIVKTFNAYGVEWVVMAGWMRIITQVLLDAFPHKILNIHPSLLPSFPGIKAVEKALNAGVKITGCTVHIACLEVDSGPILMQAGVPILPDDTPETLHARIQVQEHRIMVGSLQLISVSEST